MKKFKVGDRVKIINAGDGAYGANKKIGAVTKQHFTNGIGDRIGVETFNVILEDSGEVWSVSCNGEYELLPPKISKVITVSHEAEKTQAIINNCHFGETIKNPKDKQNRGFATIISVMRALKIDKDTECRVIKALFEETDTEIKRVDPSKMKTTDILKEITRLTSELNHRVVE